MEKDILGSSRSTFVIGFGGNFEFVGYNVSHRPCRQADG